MKTDISSAEFNSWQPSLETCLQTSSWRHLQILARNHNLPHSNRLRKADFIASLTKTLTATKTISLIIAQIEPTAQEALRSLLDAGGSLPSSPFEGRFGAIRPYRPWRNAETATDDEKPWINPNSTSERLFYHGLIYQLRFDSKALDTKSNTPLHIVIPNELLELLRVHFAAQHQKEERLTPLPRPAISGDLLNHLGVWLASLLQKPVRVRHNYWLPPSLLANLIHRLGLNAKLPCRSERHVPYLAFLHILAESCDFIAHDETVQTTPTAWQWMAKPSIERLADLWDALMPTAPDAPAFRSRIQLPWESNQTKARQLICAQLQKGTVGKSVPIDEWIGQLRLQDRWQILPGIQVGNWEDVDEEGNPWATIDPVKEFCIGPLFWLGVIDLFNDMDVTKSGDTNKLHMALTATGARLLEMTSEMTSEMPNSQMPTEVSGSHIQAVPNTQDQLIALLDVRPDYLCRIIPYCDWLDDADLASKRQGTIYQSRSGQHWLQLSAERIKLAAAAGLSATEITQDLATALGQPVSRRMGQRIRSWAKEGQRVHIQTLTVVETESAELMAELRRKKLIRRRLGPPISPNRAIIDPEQVAGLVTSLATMDIIAANPFERYSVFGKPVVGESVVGKSVVGKSVVGESVIGESVVGESVTNPPNTDLPNTDLPDTDLPNTDLPRQTQWMLLQLYRALGQHVDLSVKIPWEIEKALEAQLSAKERMSAAEAARVIAEQIESSLGGYLRIPNWQMPILMESEEDENDENDENDVDEGDEDAARTARQSKRTIKRLLQEAIATSQPLRIRYWSANHDYPLERTITPYYTEERHHIEYLIGYCHLREEERVFRVDRIEWLGGEGDR